METALIVTVFGAHTPERGSEDYERARQLGMLLAKSGFAVATGGYEGTMAGVSEGASAVGGHVIGVTSRTVERSRGVRLNRWVAQEIAYETLEERMFHLINKNEAMIVLPGGIGTLAELAVAWNLSQVRQMRPKPLVVFGSMWQEVMEVFIRPEYIKPADQDLIYFAESPEQAVDFIQESLGLA